MLAVAVEELGDPITLVDHLVVQALVVEAVIGMKKMVTLLVQGLGQVLLVQVVVVVVIATLPLVQVVQVVQAL
jgi:hypothetical protein